MSQLKREIIDKNNYEVQNFYCVYYSFKWAIRTWNFFKKYM